mmetsp:Transcript_35266/g.75127  ORF Transcript_35266/g.75127 Transcript_35266/m.75127 type:complete len:269 (-) Transcript_35266:735-1541(-)
MLGHPLAGVPAICLFQALSMFILSTYIVCEGCGMVRTLMCDCFDLLALARVKVHLAEKEDESAFLRPRLGAFRIDVGIGAFFALVAQHVVHIREHFAQRCQHFVNLSARIATVLAEPFPQHVNIIRGLSPSLRNIGLGLDVDLLHIVVPVLVVGVHLDVFGFLPRSAPTAAVVVLLLEVATAPAAGWSIIVVVVFHVLAEVAGRAVFVLAIVLVATIPLTATSNFSLCVLTQQKQRVLALLFWCDFLVVLIHEVDRDEGVNAKEIGDQ